MRQVWCKTNTATESTSKRTLAGQSLCLQSLRNPIWAKEAAPPAPQAEEEEEEEEEVDVSSSLGMHFVSLEEELDELVTNIMNFSMQQE
jgi:hypothetical protein